MKAVHVRRIEINSSTRKETVDENSSTSNAGGWFLLVCLLYAFLSVKPIRAQPAIQQCPSTTNMVLFPAKWPRSAWKRIRLILHSAPS